MNVLNLLFPKEFINILTQSTNLVLSAYISLNLSYVENSKPNLRTLQLSFHSIWNYHSIIRPSANDCFWKCSIKKLFLKTLHYSQKHIPKIISQRKFDYGLFTNWLRLIIPHDFSPSSFKLKRGGILPLLSKCVS